jgi:hypothetical protein
MQTGTTAKTAAAKTNLEDESPLPPYQGSDAMPIAGTWRAGRANERGTDFNPFTGEELLEIPLASADPFHTEGKIVPAQHTPRIYPF